MFIMQKYSSLYLYVCVCMGEREREKMAVSLCAIRKCGNLVGPTLNFVFFPPLFRCWILSLVSYLGTEGKRGCALGTFSSLCQLGPQSTIPGPLVAHDVPCPQPFKYQCLSFRDEPVEA